MSSSASAAEKTSNPAGIIAALAGVGLGFYVGVMLLIPLAGTVVGFFIVKYAASRNTKPFGGALAVQFGHWIWMTVGALLVPSGVLMIAPDVLIAAASLVWLFLWPGLVPVVLVTLYQAISLMLNALQLRSFEFGAEAHKAIATHMFLRILIIAYLIEGYRVFRKVRNDIHALS